ncbi:helix-turn-helix transcriptional regulator [Streptomyces sp. TRM72054]|uniref:winged helix-turn-helix transcriptional regulator n=1 Tax=Streptomyces sp. TRM72054 TaxID=2870562 RepID=UPI001C8C2A6F|nr:helix-turn-helix domain-containing protein [Streptomyces sp. TRM72054]MBX9397249.1 helix-turn-helix transcriptional regulator [Streptomyces sp. TRM72054]
MSVPSPTPSDGDDTAQWAANVFFRACASRPVLEHIASKWGALALAALREGPYRFNALRRRVDGVSEKMLSQTLHALERDGMVNRHEHSAIPPRVEYSLTPLGTQVADRLIDVIQLLESALPQITVAQQRYDAARQPAPSEPSE